MTAARRCAESSSAFRRVGRSSLQHALRRRTDSSARAPEHSTTVRGLRQHGHCPQSGDWRSGIGAPCAQGLGRPPAGLCTGLAPASSLLEGRGRSPHPWGSTLLPSSPANTITWGSGLPHVSLGTRTSSPQQRLPTSDHMSRRWRERKDGQCRHRVPQAFQSRCLVDIKENPPEENSKAESSEFTELGVP